MHITNDVKVGIIKKMGLKWTFFCTKSTPSTKARVNSLYSTPRISHITVLKIWTVPGKVCQVLSKASALFSTLILKYSSYYKFIHL